MRILHFYLFAIFMRVACLKICCAFRSFTFQLLITRLIYSYSKFCVSRKSLLEIVSEKPVDKRERRELGTFYGEIVRVETRSAERNRRPNSSRSAFIALFTACSIELSQIALRFLKFLVWENVAQVFW